MLNFFKKRKENSNQKSLPIEALSLTADYFVDEFLNFYDKSSLKSIAIKELDIFRAIDTIARQFFMFETTAKKDDNLIDNDIANALNRAGASLHYNVIFDLLATGESFIYFDPILNIVSHLPSEHVERNISKETGSVVSYKYGDNTFSTDYIIDIKLPHPQNPLIGFSKISALTLEILLRKYIKEWSVAFFLRGGQFASQYETELSDANSLARLLASLHQMSTSRRNMHADKVLPRGVKLASESKAFNTVPVVELIRANSREVSSLFGVPPVAFGDTDGVNYASAKEQMRFFWVATILPLQNLYLSAFNKHKRLSNSGIILQPENSKVPYLDDFNERLQQDANLRDILTINERRKRLGFPLIEGGDIIPTIQQISPFMLLSQGNIEEKSIIEMPSVINEDDIFIIYKSNSVPNAFLQFFENEIEEWFKEAEKISKRDDFKEILADILLDRKTFIARKISELTIDDAMKFYDFHKKRLKTPVLKAIPDRIAQELDKKREESRQFIAEKIKYDSYKTVQSIINTFSERLINKYSKYLEEGLTLSEIFMKLRTDYKEQYSNGHLMTVVNTEYRRALHTSSLRFGIDIANYAQIMKKTWLAKVDNATRDSHIELDNKSITGKSNEIIDVSFSRKAILRYPYDSLAPANETINCRCMIEWSVLDWK
ncbi:MAG: phage portal protein [Candidatus Bilamarchaeaceae archaeon]